VLPVRRRRSTPRRPGGRRLPYGRARGTALLSALRPAPSPNLGLSPGHDLLCDPQGTNQCAAAKHRNARRILRRSPTFGAQTARPASSWGHPRHHRQLAQPKCTWAMSFVVAGISIVGRAPATPQALAPLARPALPPNTSADAAATLAFTALHLPPAQRDPCRQKRQICPVIL